MENTKINTNKSRRKFLQICGSVVAGGAIAVASAGLVKRSSLIGSVLDDSDDNLQKDSFVSPYKLVSSFSVPAGIDAFEISKDNMIVSAGGNIYLYTRSGQLINSFSTGNNLRDITTDDDNIYLLFPTYIEVYNTFGEKVSEWSACSELSDYCSIAVAHGAVFVTDVANKNICKYTTEGNFVKFINSPDGFIIPSYSIGITYANDIIYCSNPGRHKVEKYSLGGDYLGSFGYAGASAGMFGGCCNPVHLSTTHTGEIITSEKGNPRISCFDANGEFRSVLLDSNLLGGGNTAFDVKVDNDKLFVAGNNMVSTFQYDNTLAAATSCSACKAGCPLRTTTRI